MARRWPVLRSSNFDIRTARVADIQDARKLFAQTRAVLEMVAGSGKWMQARVVQAAKGANPPFKILFDDGATTDAVSKTLTFSQVINEDERVGKGNNLILGFVGGTFTRAGVAVKVLSIQPGRTAKGPTKVGYVRLDKAGKADSTGVTLTTMSCFIKDFKPTQAFADKDSFNFMEYEKLAAAMRKASAFDDGSDFTLKGATALDWLGAICGERVTSIEAAASAADKLTVMLLAGLLG